MTPARETLHLEPSVQATHPPYSGRRGVAPEDKSALRKAAKVAWNAAPPFHVASDAELWGKALAAALRTNSILDAASTLAQQGVPVFPVSPVGQKKPLNAHGVYSATTDLAVVEREFRRDIERADRRAHGPPDWCVRDRCRCLPATRPRRRRSMASTGGEARCDANARPHDIERRPPPALPLAARTSGRLHRQGSAEGGRMQRRRRRDRLPALRARRQEV